MVTMKIATPYGEKRSSTEHADYEAALEWLHRAYASGFNLDDEEPTSEVLLETMADRGWSIQIIDDKEAVA